MNDNDFTEMLKSLVQWHQERVENCHLVIDQTDADLCLIAEDGQESVIKAGSRDARLIRLGWMLALEQFIPFPLQITQSGDETDEDEDDE